jgi:LmbE family N-acetylglucosaminyl deacetylase
MCNCHVFLSPHFDDAVLSVGGFIHQLTARGNRVWVFTVFAGKPWPVYSELAVQLHKCWGNPSDVVALRTAEDEQALACLGAEGKRLSLLDCVYRGRTPTDWYYNTKAALYGELHPGDLNLAPAICSAIAKELPASSSTACVYAPLAIGNHVDHQLVSLAATELMRQGYPVAFYEDFPYLVDCGRDIAGYPLVVSEQLVPDQVALAPQDLAKRIAAVACYRSQLAALFGGAEKMAELVKDTCQSVGGGQPVERLWKQPHLPRI